MMATLSPAFTVRLTPRRTRTGPAPPVLALQLLGDEQRLTHTEHVHRVHARGPPGRRNGGEEGDHQGRPTIIAKSEPVSFIGR